MLCKIKGIIEMTLPYSFRKYMLVPVLVPGIKYTHVNTKCTLVLL